jgi:hypothetical protein
MGATSKDGREIEPHYILLKRRGDFYVEIRLSLFPLSVFARPDRGCLYGDSTHGE